ncbi:hypothetical protein ACH5RR_031521 [Cinchona calisaya]|uniref:Probable glutathione S-transferase n=1 Tax=Cinchona calisaya TaxID=153742 RepID=A0ABD2YJI8_9GENT
MEESQGGKLLGFWVSPYVIRVKWALKLKGVEHEYIEEDVFNKSPLLLKLNPVHGQVPVLVHDGKPISESIVILEYIDQVWKQNPLLPQDPFGRAKARFWAKFAAEKLQEYAWKALCSRGEEHERAVKSSIEALENMEEELNGKKYFGGDKIGFVDLVAGFISYQLPVYEEIACMKILDSSKFPAITKWIDSFRNHPLIEQELPPKDKMLAYFSKRRNEILLVENQTSSRK